MIKTVRTNLLHRQNPRFPKCDHLLCFPYVPVARVQLFTASRCAGAILRTSEMFKTVAQRKLVAGVHLNRRWTKSVRSFIISTNMNCGSPDKSTKSNRRERRLKIKYSRRTFRPVCMTVPYQLLKETHVWLAKIKFEVANYHILKKEEWSALV